VRTTTRHGRSNAALLAATWLMAAGIAACQTSTTTISPAAPVDTGPGSVGSPIDLSTPGPSGPVLIDPTLLRVLPKDVGGVAVAESSDADTDALADDVLPTIASAAVGLIAVDAEANNLVTGYVVKLLPGAMTDAIFRDWRDSYDSGVCAGDTEVVGHAETTIGGNTVYIGTCSGGTRTYHVLLKDRSILISVSSVGDRRLGLVLLQTLPK
jgi:hypothetical protein